MAPKYVEQVGSMMNYMLEYTVPRSERSFNPYRVFLANFTLQVMNRVSPDIIEKMILRAGIANEISTLSYQEIMSDLWEKIQVPYDEAVRLATTMGGDYIDFKDSSHNTNLDLVTNSFNSVLKTIYFINHENSRR